MDKKEKIKALEQHFGVKAIYLGVPSCAYEIRTEDETLTIDRGGLIKNSKGEEHTLEMILNAEPSGQENQTKIQNMPEDLDIDGFEVEFPFEGHSGATLLNIVCMLSSKQRLIARAFDIKEALLDTDFAEALSSKEPRTLENFKAAIVEVGLERCTGLSFDFDKGTFTFRLVAEQLNQDKLTAFKDLAVLINTNAKILKHASFKPVQDENPKYAFRTWLTRLGMIGDGYKTTRKLLLANLEGSGAFRKPKRGEE